MKKGGGVDTPPPDTTQKEMKKMLGKGFAGLMASLFVLLGTSFTIMAQVYPPIFITEEAKKLWFNIGYCYDDASDREDIEELEAMLPEDMPEELRRAISEWKENPEEPENKHKVRPPLIAHAKSNAGHLGRLGEWCSQVEYAVYEVIFGSLIEDEEMIAEGLVSARVLSEMASHFVDVLSHDVPEDAIQVLKQIGEDAAKICIEKCIFGSPPDEELEVMLETILDLQELMESIKEVFEFEER